MRVLPATVVTLLTSLPIAFNALAAASTAVDAPPISLQTCEGIAQSFTYPNTEFAAAKAVATGDAKQGAIALPAHCLVTGSMYRRTGTDGNEYQIGFEMRLPVQWNGRFYYQANGGLDGAVLPAYGALGGGPVTGALIQGFAVISSDAGHNLKQTAAFGNDPQARLDYGYQAVQKLTPMAKQLIVAAYGHAANKSYIGGCSNGGRHAMVAAARMGNQYDGFLIGAPGYRLPYAALNQVWSAQQFKPLATPGATTPHPMNPGARIADLTSAFTDQERLLVSHAVLNRCDALDGLKDGIVSDYRRCQQEFNVERDVPTCDGARDGSCLRKEQKQMLATLFAGPHTADGKPMYSAFPFDAGISGSNWGLWKQKFSLVLDPLALGSVFSTPPNPVMPLSEDIESRYAGLKRKTAPYTESADEFMLPPGQDDPQYTVDIQRHNGKMMVFHGSSDPVFSVDDTRAWVDRVGAIQGKDTSNFLRFFPVPSMNHCSGGPATDQFDMLTPLVAWVEQGTAPEFVVATARGKGNAGGANTELPENWSDARTRLLCAYPKTAYFNGSGPTEDHRSFSCR